jgi:hypothetical protein
VGAELVAEYMVEGVGTFPAGVAYTHPTMGFQTVNLGFGIESMLGDRMGNGFFWPGAADRIDLIENILNYFGLMVHATEVDEAHDLAVTSLGRPRPNPFNPATTIEYSITAHGRVSLRVYDPPGRLVRTLVDDDLDAGEHRAVWDGTTGEGLRAASGVYFVRMETGGFCASEKLVLLK